MELRAGYKRTEIGVIPEDWEIRSIGDTMKLINGRAFKPSDWKESGVPIIRIQNLNDPDSSFNFFRGSVEDRNRVDCGDLLFAWSGTKGTSFGARIWSGPTGVLNQHIFKIIPNTQRVTLRYSYLVLLNVQEQIEKQAHGFKASFVHVKKSDLVGVQLPLPPNGAEQEAIATALSDVDTLLAKIDQLIAKKRDLKQAAMQQLLTGQTRLPGFSGEWEVKRLGDLLSYEQPTPYLVKSAEYNDGNSMPVLTAGKTFILGYTNETDGVYSSPPVIIFDDFTTASKFVDFPFKAKSSAMKILKAREGRAHIRFAFERMQVIDFQLGDHKRYWISEYSKLPIETPSLVEQIAIAAILTDMDAELSALEARRDKTRVLKQGMMQALLTGRIRLVGDK